MPVKIYLMLFAGLMGWQASASAQQLRWTFDADPGWQGLRNRQLPLQPPSVLQSFGFRSTRCAGGVEAGEIGGWISRSVTPAWYATKLNPISLEGMIEASGKLAVTKANNGSGALIGFFNHTSRGRRTSNSLALRIDGNGGNYWVLFEYRSSKAIVPMEPSSIDSACGICSLPAMDWNCTSTI